MTENPINQVANAAVTAGSDRRGDARAELFEHVGRTLVELFQLPRERITPEARLFDDLEIDSIDVVDLMEQIGRIAGKKVAAEDFHAVRTVGDLVDVLQRLHP